MSETKRPPSKVEELLERLETIVAALERDDLELEKALGLFEEGVGHLRETRLILRQAELVVEQLLAEGEFEAADDGERT